MKRGMVMLSKKMVNKLRYEIIRALPKLTSAEHGQIFGLSDRMVRYLKREFKSSEAVAKQ